MKTAAAALAFAIVLAIGSPVSAAERIVTLAVENMYCAVCPLTVKKSLEAVAGVRKVVVSYEEKTAVVTYDDARTDVPALTRATTDAGYPSAPRSGG